MSSCKRRRHGGFFHRRAATTLTLLLVSGPLVEGSYLRARKDVLRRRNFSRFQNETLRSFANTTDFQFQDEFSFYHDFCENNSNGSRRPEEWYRQCHQHLNEADTLSPRGSWTMSEFTTFIRLHFENRIGWSDLSHLPLPLVMVFHELACRCVHSENANPNCCVGEEARILAPLNTRHNKDGEAFWTRSICRQIDHALDAICHPHEREEL